MFCRTDGGLSLLFVKKTRSFVYTIFVFTYFAFLYVFFLFFLPLSLLCFQDDETDYDDDLSDEDASPRQPPPPPPPHSSDSAHTTDTRGSPRRDWSPSKVRGLGLTLVNTMEWVQYTI